MAQFCVALKMPPSEFKKLTLLEYNELAAAFGNNPSRGIEELLNGW
jgi:hypothetical protein